MRTVDLAVYADVLSAEAGALARRLERARARLRQAAIEHEARESLGSELVARLERLGLLGAIRERDELEQIEELCAALEAVERLQAWVEARLAAAERRDEAFEADWGALARSASQPPTRLAVSVDSMLDGPPTTGEAARPEPLVEDSLRPCSNRLRG